MLYPMMQSNTHTVAHPHSNLAHRSLNTYFSDRAGQLRAQYTLPIHLGSLPAPLTLLLVLHDGIQGAEVEHNTWNSRLSLRGKIELHVHCTRSIDV